MRASVWTRVVLFIFLFHFESVAVYARDPVTGEPDNLDEFGATAHAVENTFTNPNNSNETIVTTEIPITNEQELTTARNFAANIVREAHQLNPNLKTSFVTLDGGDGEPGEEGKLFGQAVGPEFFADLKDEAPNSEAVHVKAPKGWLSRVKSKHQELAERMANWPEERRKRYYERYHKGYYNSLIVIRGAFNSSGGTLGLLLQYKTKAQMPWSALSGAEIGSAAICGAVGGSLSAFLQWQNQRYERILNYDGFLGIAADPEDEPDRARAEQELIDKKTWLAADVLKAWKNRSISEEIKSLSIRGLWGAWKEIYNSRDSYEGKKFTKEFGLISLLVHFYFVPQFIAKFVESYSLEGLEVASAFNLFAETGALFAIFKMQRLDSVANPEMTPYFKVRSAALTTMFSLLVTSPQIVAAGGDEFSKQVVIGLGLAGWAVYALTFVNSKSLWDKINSWKQTWESVRSNIYDACFGTFARPKI